MWLAIIKCLLVQSQIMSSHFKLQLAFLAFAGSQRDGKRRGEAFISLIIV